jgi:hypothetical protein
MDIPIIITSTTRRISAEKTGTPIIFNPNNQTSTGIVNLFEGESVTMTHRPKTFAFFRFCVVRPLSRVRTQLANAATSRESTRSRIANIFLSSHSKFSWKDGLSTLIADHPSLMRLRTCHRQFRRTSLVGRPAVQEQFRTGSGRTSTRLPPSCIRRRARWNGCWTKAPSIRPLGRATRVLIR